MKSVTDETFNNDVIVRSETLPVIVDLWAPWCEPCKSLTPILETVVAKTNSAVELVAVNIDENPQIRQTFQVQSIPAVFGISNGEVIDAFVGAKGESEVAAFIEGLLPSPQDEILTSLLEEGSEQSLEEILQAIPDHVEAVTRLAKIYVENSRSDEALELLKRVPESPETRHIAAQARTGDRPQTEILERLDELLKIVKSDEAARKEFVDLLDVLGPENSETKTYRQKLSREIY